MNYSKNKILIDFFLSILFLLFFFWVILIIIVYLKITIGSPVFFIQTRVGQFEKCFKLIKFRTMKIDTDNLGTHLLKGNVLTKNGSFLRRFKLDELPQVFNVFLCQMSFVGPRPCLTNQNEIIKERSKRNIFNLKPGITGLSQINNIDMSRPKYLSKVDLLYKKNISLKLDILMIFSTLIGRGINKDQMRKKV
tara:strand:- start:50 stop:628 length:579 start_codon:yes stop_codon:yes gene_type:complete